MKTKILWVASLAAMLFASCSQSTETQSIVVDSKAEYATLKDAFNQLSRIPGVSADSIPDIKFGKHEVRVEKSAVAMNLDRQQIEATGNAMYSILDGVPMGYIVNGATNHLAAGFVYANHISSDKNEVLIVACSGGAGMYMATYGTASDSTVEALQMAPLSMQGPQFALQLEDTPQHQVYLINFYN